MDKTAKTVELTNSDVANKYSNTYTHNPIVHVPGVYRGLLSNITMAGADAAFAQKHQALVLKPTGKPTKPGAATE